jgi:selenocysteine-specific elongation factor
MAMVDESGATGLASGALESRGGLTRAAADRLRSQLTGDGRILEAGGRLFAAPIVTQLEERLLRQVQEHVKANPTSEGLPREEARERILRMAPPAFFDFIVQRLSARGAIAGRDRLGLPGKGVTLTAEETRAHEALSKVYAEAGLAPPDLPGAAASAGITPALADRMTKLMVRGKTLVKIDTLLFDADVLHRLKGEVQSLKSVASTLDVAGFKDRFGLSRKYAIPLLEWLDRERVTRRAGEARLIL